MKKFVGFETKPLVNVNKVHFITKEDHHTTTAPDGVQRYLYMIKFTFASNRSVYWHYKGEGAVAGAMAQDDRDRDYETLKEMLL